MAYESEPLVPPILGSTLTIIMYHLRTTRLDQGKLELYKTETLVTFSFSYKVSSFPTIEVFP